ncbi:uncharacterized protein LOC120294110 [Eucalyptus grandis]|uniref:uncharacterized protein LOC120294110 n=1 Tax=Eucalyptus grandis TaxID=71139 RepID=UPI00192E8BBE|nr:uncharacterized protein LOC120294110 [Eucalyptus grandis]
MKLLCWNCQGLGTPLTIQALRVLATQERPSIMFIMETKNQELKVQRIRRRLKFHNGFVVNPEGIGGGLALFWDEQIVAQKLGEWSKNRTVNADIRIKVLRNELQRLTNSVGKEKESETAKQITQELEKLWSQEEMYWGMRSRITWLKCGDRNTKFFHASTIQRRSRNRITLLKNAEEEWVNEEQSLKEMTVASSKTYITQLGLATFSL